MNVRLPLNIEDEDIELSDTGLALSTPTAMSYTLCRIRLAEISREIADETTDQHFQGKDLPYDTVVALDSKLRAGLNALPEFYRFSPAAQQQFATLCNERPVFASQRSMLQLGYHFRLCRLHRQHFYESFPPPGVEVLSWNVLMGVGQVVTLRFPAERLREVNRAVEQTAWGGYHTEFYPTYDYRPTASKEREGLPSSFK